MTQTKATNITWHEGHVTPAERQQLLKQQGATLWFTGLSGSGKSTIAFTLEHALVQQGRLAYVLDGDNVRHGLNKDLGFTTADRIENVRRTAEVASLMAEAGLIVLVSLISPYRAERRMARDLAGNNRFLEIYVDTPLEVAESRDRKGLYAKARRGEIPNFTGIGAPYEAPDNPDAHISTAEYTPEAAADAVIRLL
jgi:adenylyl-sulfate kinase